LTDKIKPGDRV